jgi:hypothetical protein
VNGSKGRVTNEVGLYQDIQYILTESNKNHKLQLEGSEEKRYTVPSKPNPLRSPIFYMLIIPSLYPGPDCPLAAWRGQR